MSTKSKPNLAVIPQEQSDEDSFVDNVDVQVERCKSLKELQEEHTRYTEKKFALMTGAKMARPDLKYAGMYDGSEPAERWLRRLDYDLEPTQMPDGTIPSRLWVNTFTMLLTGPAASWMESTEQAQHILSLQVPSPSDVQTLKALVTAQFPVTVRPLQKFVDLDVMKLEQGKEESLEDYFARGMRIATDAGVTKPADGWEPAARSQNNMLRAVVRAWVNGLHDRQVRLRCEDRLPATPQPLDVIYEMAREATESQARVKRELERERRDQEFELYRTIATERLPTQELTARLAALDLNQNDYGYFAPPPLRPSNPRWSNPRPFQSYARPVGSPQNSYGNTFGRQVQFGNGPSARSDERWRQDSQTMEDTIARSDNPYVNGSRSYTREVGLLCVRCGQVGHRSTDCGNAALSQNEQQVLRDMCFGQSKGMANGSNGASGFRGGMNNGTNTARNAPRQGRDMPPMNGHSLTATFHGNANAAYNDYSDDYCPEVMAGSGRPKKRTQLQMEDGEPEEEPETVAEPTFPRSPTSPKKRPGLAPIRAFVDPESGLVDKPVSIRQLLKDQKISLSIADLCQYSPKFSVEARHLMGRVVSSKKKKRTGPKKKPVAPDMDTEVLSGNVRVHNAQHTTMVSEMKNEDRAFRVKATIKYDKNGRTTTMELPKSRVHADAGADMNTIAEPIVEEWGLEKHPLSLWGMQRLAMNTAAYESTPLTHYVEFDVGVAGIWRSVTAVVVPASKSSTTKSENHLILLGLPWLHMVNAYIGIRASTIWVGDDVQGETPVAVKGAEQTFSQGHSIMLYPKELVQKYENEDSEESEEDSMDSETSSEESF